MRQHTFSTSYFHEEHILDVSNIEERIQAMNFHRVEKRGLLIITSIWKIDNSSLQKEENISIEKKDLVELYDTIKSNTPQYHIAKYYGGMWVNR